MRIWNIFEINIYLAKIGENHLLQLAIEGGLGDGGYSFQNLVHLKGMERCS